MRREDELVDFMITRAKITVPNIETRILDGDIAYIQLNQFSSHAREELDTAIDELDVQDRAGLIFDLRDNPGGLLSSAIDIASAFVPEGPVVIEAFGDGREQVFEADGTYADLGVPVVVLVNEASASASELVAGALQDTDNAYIIGETTLGKGTVQQWLPLQNDAGLRLTIARWLTPDRRWIHLEGITPDEIIEWAPTIYEDPNDPQLEAAVDWLQQAEVAKDAA
jgi:carboxyl-terminal processing protease